LERTQDEKIDRALQEIKFGRFLHYCRTLTTTIALFGVESQQQSKTP